MPEIKFTTHTYPWGSYQVPAAVEQAADLAKTAEQRALDAINHFYASQMQPDGALRLYFMNSNPPSPADGDLWVHNSVHKRYSALFGPDPRQNLFVDQALQDVDLPHHYVQAGSKEAYGELEFEDRPSVRYTVTSTSTQFRAGILYTPAVTGAHTISFSLRSTKKANLRSFTLHLADQEVPVLLASADTPGRVSITAELEEGVEYQCYVTPGEGEEVLAGDVVFIGAVLVELGEEALPFFDGNSPAGSWMGAEGNSISVYAPAWLEDTTGGVAAIAAVVEESHYVDGYVDIFVGEEPGFPEVGDLWDDDLENLWRWTGSQWIPLVDATSPSIIDQLNQQAQQIANALAQLVQIEDRLDGVVEIYYSPTAPANPQLGDLWFDLSNGRLLKRWDGDSWEEVSDERIAELLEEVDSKITTYWQDSEPTGGTYTVGDLWFETDQNNKPHRWNGSAWVDISDTRVDQLYNETIRSVEIEYSVSISDTIPPVTGWSTDTPERNPGEYIWFRTKITYADNTVVYTSPAPLTGNTGPEGPQGVPGPPGNDGQSLYTWVKYADDDSGTGMSDDPTGKEYIGLAYNKTSPIESSNPADYQWYLFKGEQGDPGVPGPPGADGQSLYTWIKYADDASGTGMSDSPTGKSYIGLAYNKTTPTESTNPADYSWALYQGPQGIQGPPGADGSDRFTWIKYADDASGSGMSDSPTGKAYLGIAYNKTTATESTDPADYSWSLIQGPQGDQGVPGPPGEDGQPTYTWIKYADDSSGGGMSDDPTGKTYMGIAYNKTTPTESTDPADYQWALIKGADGAPAPTVHLTSTGHVLISPPSGTGTTTPASVEVTAAVTGTTITGWQFAVNGGSFSGTVPAGVTGSGSSRTVTGSTMTADTIALRVNTAAGVSDTLTIAKVKEGPEGEPGDPGAPGADAITVVLSNEAHTFPGDVNNALAGNTTTTVTAYKGATPQNVTVGTITGQTAGQITASVSGNSSTAPVITVTVTTALTATSGELTIPLTVDGKSFTKKFAWSVARKGSPGTDAPIITLTPTTQVLVSPPGGGATTPATSVITGTATGTSITTWDYAVNGSTTFSTTAPAGVSRTGNEVTITGSTMTANTIAVRASGGGVSDIVTVAKVSNGATGGTGSPGADGLTVILTNESHVFAGDVNNALAGSTKTYVKAWKGATAQNINVTGVNVNGVTGISASVTAGNNTTNPEITINVTTSLTAQNGQIDITCTIDGKTITKAFTWSVSRKGSQGIQGPPGADGTSLYTWIKYANDASGTGMSDSPTGKTYMGIAYNKTSPTESSNPADYEWSLIKGDQGIQGPPGADGQPTYTWVKYADNASGGGLSDDPTGKKYIGLAYNKTTPTESTNPADYQWALIQGPAGQDGVSVVSITPYWAQVAANAAAPALPTTSPPPAPWTSTEPPYAPGTVLYRTERIIYSAGSPSFAYTTVVRVSSYDGVDSARGESWSNDGDSLVGVVARSGTLPAITSVTDASGGYVLRSTSVSSWPVFTTGRMAYDPNKLYKVSAKIRRVTGTNGTYYLGLEGLAADGTTLVNTAGTNSSSSQHYVGAAAATPPANGTWVVVKGYVKGHGATGTAAARPDPTTPGVMHTDVRYIQPLVILNYTGTNGNQWELDWVKLEVADQDADIAEIGNDITAITGTVTSLSGMVTTSTVAPTDADATDKPTGAMWYRYDGSNKLIGVWRVNHAGGAGQKWLPMTLEAGEGTWLGKVNIGTGTAGELDVGRLSAGTLSVTMNIGAGGTIRAGTSGSGERAEMRSTGFFAYNSSNQEIFSTTGGNVTMRGQLRALGSSSSGVLVRPNTGVGWSADGEIVFVPKTAGIQDHPSMRLFDTTNLNGDDVKNLRIDSGRHAIQSGVSANVASLNLMTAYSPNTAVSSSDAMLIANDIRLISYNRIAIGNESTPITRYIDIGRDEPSTETNLLNRLINIGVNSAGAATYLRSLATYATGSFTAQGSFTASGSALFYGNTTFNSSVTFSSGVTIGSSNITSAWTTYTPTWYGSTTNPGSPHTRTGAYKVIGKTVFFTINITVGSGGVGSGLYSFSLPLNAVTTRDFVCWGHVVVSGSGEIGGVAKIEKDAPDRVSRIYLVNQTRANNWFSAFGNTFPSSLPQGSRITITGHYEIP